MTNLGGRPKVGNTISVAMGETLAVCNAWADDHGQTRAEAIRDLVIRGTATARGERILESSWQKAKYTPEKDIEVIERYQAAIEDGTVLRYTGSPDSDDPEWIKLARYTDPLDDSIRYLVDIQQSDGGEQADYPDSATATRRYESAVREQAGCGYRYDVTDVDGVVFVTEPE